jgi:hypothetical protein
VLGLGVLAVASCDTPQEDCAQTNRGCGDTGTARGGAGARGGANGSGGATCDLSCFSYQEFTCIFGDLFEYNFGRHSCSDSCEGDLVRHCRLGCNDAGDDCIDPAVGGAAGSSTGGANATGGGGAAAVDASAGASSGGASSAGAGGMSRGGASGAGGS